MKMNLVLLVTAVLAVTMCESEAVESTPAPVSTDTTSKVIVEFTKNRWTPDNVLIATGTLKNTNAEAVRITNMAATGFDTQRRVVDNQENAEYTIGNSDIAAGESVIFKVALNDPKKAIRFVKATPLVATPTPVPTPTPIPTPKPFPTPTSTPAPTPDPAVAAGPKPDVGGLWGVSLMVHDAIKEKLNDPDSYKFVGVYEPKVSDFGGKPCWLELVKFRSKNGFGGYISSTAGVFLVVTGGVEKVLAVVID